jgi:hypothetical protein
MKPAHLCQVGDFAWEVRAESGTLCACVTFDDESGNFYVSSGDCDCEFFRTFREACAYAFGGAP